LNVQQWQESSEQAAALVHHILQQHSGHVSNQKIKKLENKRKTKRKINGGSPAHPEVTRGHTTML